MKNITEISAESRICAVIGDPVGHSLSPQIHNAAFSASGIDMLYTAFHVRKGDLERALNGIRALGIKGLSVTIPHKVDLIPFLDEVDAEALAIVSVNTIINSSGVLIGFSTDGPGAIRALRAESVAVEGSSVLILGSGGAARAIAFALRSLRPQPVVQILGIDDPETTALAEDLNKKAPGNIKEDAPAVSVGSLNVETLEKAMAEADIVIHATPIGMSPNTGESLVPARLFRKDQVVFDVVYTPRETKLLRQAKKAGSVTVSGLGMFVNQAAIQFELWTGKPAPVEIMLKAVEQALYNNPGK
ncbi:MAG: shikimate dehydrogenase [Acidobacteriota bacterium]